MMMLLWGWLAGGLAGQPVNAAEDPVHNELRALRTELQRDGVVFRSESDT